MRITIPLTRGFSAIIDAEDTHLVAPFKWRARVIHAADGSERVYAHAHCMNGKMRRDFQLHRHLTNAPADRVVDHIDGNPLHNWRSNLRVCTSAENHRNGSRHSDGKFAYKGIEECYPGRYYARIVYNGQRRRVGGFRTIEEAAKAYDALAVELFGEFARLNFPENGAASARRWGA